MELDKALQLAVIAAWEDLTKVYDSTFVRIEYVCKRGGALDHLSVWSVRGKGYLSLVCDYWAGNSEAHRSGTRFSNGYSSVRLARNLDFIMKNQILFTRLADACRHGLVLANSPDAEDRAEASTWMRGMHHDATLLGALAHAV